VAATARLIECLRDRNSLKRLLGIGDEDCPQSFRADLNDLIFAPSPSRDDLTLMMAAFYHDLGKTVVGHRHPMEGGAILADHTSVALQQLNKIYGSYNFLVSLRAMTFCFFLTLSRSMTFLERYPPANRDICGWPMLLTESEVIRGVRVATEGCSISGF